MKFTSEDLMKAMGLQVGDRIKMLNVEYKIIQYSDGTPALKRICDGKELHIKFLLEINYETLPIPKRVGESLCGEQAKISCNNCPITSICILCDLGCRNTLYEFLEDYKNHHKESFDQEIYDLLKARLDKEVE